MCYIDLSVAELSNTDLEIIYILNLKVLSKHTGLMDITGKH